jgi:hypothetical protein
VYYPAKAARGPITLLSLKKAMRIRCLYNDIQAIPDAELRASAARRIHLQGEIDGLIPGKEYVVQAISRRGSETLYYIELWDNDTYPSPWPAAFFDISHGSIPTTWVSAQQNDTTITTFPYWALDPMFFERLIDGDGEAIYMSNRVSESAQPTVQADGPAFGGPAA